jgi:L-lactate dehydrogenase complex protein LldG
MDSRSKILNSLQTEMRPSPLPEMPVFPVGYIDMTDQFTNVVRSIGGTVINVQHLHEVEQYIAQTYGSDSHILSAYPGLSFSFAPVDVLKDYNDLKLTVLKGALGVAENGAVWVIDKDMHDRVIPFITEHLLVIISAQSLVATMHHAYALIGEADYSFGTFIAGPSKTADIEQSLVLGAHGPKSMTVALLH